MPYKRLQEIGSYKVDPPTERSLQLLFTPQVDRGIKNCTVLMASLVPRTGRSGLHSHTVDEIMYVVTGEGEMAEGGKTFKIGPGTAIYAPAGVEHESRNLGEETMQIFCVYLPSLSDEKIEEYVRDSVGGKK
jgi:mannose-6-phosphate isomerase-like protein (cupin superfamily)